VRRSRRQLVNRIFETIGLGLVMVDLLVYFGAYRPLRNLKAGEQQEFSRVRQRVRDQQVRVEQMQKFEAALPEAGKLLEDFITDRVPPRRHGYSTADHLIQKVADASGVKTASVGFRLDTTHNDPLQRLSLDIIAQGPYPGLVKFAHALETAEDFIVIRDFTFAPAESGAGTGPGTINLRLGADLYLTP
jgi:hypothetical protein